MRGALSWDAYLSAIGSIVPTSAESIARESVLVADLGFDSLALAELLVTVMDHRELDITSTEIETISWNAVTVGELFDALVAA